VQLSGKKSNNEHSMRWEFAAFGILWNTLILPNYAACWRLLHIWSKLKKLETRDARMKLGNLSPPQGAIGKKKRLGIGPGSGKGKTAGKGHKGQRARSGSKRKVGFEGGQSPLHRLLPKV